MNAIVLWVGNRPAQEQRSILREGMELLNAVLSHEPGEGGKGEELTSRLRMQEPKKGSGRRKPGA